MKFYIDGDFSDDILVFKQENWNDFGYKTFFHCTLIKKNKRIAIGTVSFATIKEAKIAYEEASQKKNSTNWVQYDVSKYLKEKYSNKLDNNIITLGSVEYYQNLYKYLDIAAVHNILINLNDMAYNINLYEENKDVDIINTSLLRGINTYTLKNQLARIARNGKEKIKYSFNLEYFFSTGKQSLSFKVNPDSDLPSNVFALIGNNGTGKTTIIHDMVKAYLMKENVETTLSSGAKVSLTFSDEDQNEPLESILFISFSPFDVLDPIYFSSNNKENMFNYVGNSVFKENKQFIKDPSMLSKDLIEYIKKIKNSPERTDMWQRYISKLVFDHQIGKFIKLLNKTENIEDNKFINDVSKLSSGQKMIILGISALIAQVTEKTLVIIDEPESYLHPPLVSAYVRILSEILKENNGVAILATHSPIIVQEIPQNCVWVLERSSEIEFRHPLIETFGENIGVIMDDIFKLDIRNTGFYSYLTELTESKSVSLNNLSELKLGSEAKMFFYALLEDA